MGFIPQMEPWFDDNEARALYDYMQSGGWVTEFRKTREFEGMIASYTDTRFCSVVNNGTVAIVLALLSCGIGPGDAVIVPGYTMVASANAVKLVGAEAVFVDISLENLCMDFKKMHQACVSNSKVKAVILVSINGRYPEGLEEFVDYCQQHKLKLIEDAAQSLGSFKDARHLGTFGDIGTFSFSVPKVITTGQGGALITDQEGLIERIRKLRDFGRAQGGSDHYLTMGWNFKFTDIQAVIGLEQMRKLPWRIQRKKEIYALYQRHLEGIKEISFIPTKLEDTSPWFIDILVASGPQRRDDLIDYLKEKGIGARRFYPALHTQPAYVQYKDVHCPVAERVAGEGLWLPSSSKLTDEQIDYICNSIKGFFTK